MKKLIIEVALNEYVTREENATVPLTEEEIAEQARECYEAGASIVHFHPRNAGSATGTAAFDTGRVDDIKFYRRTMALIADRCDVVAYPTYSSALTGSPDDSTKRLFPHVRELRESGRPALETFVFFIGATGMGRWSTVQEGWVSDFTSGLPHRETASFLEWCRASGLTPQFGVREIGHLRHIGVYRDLGLVADPIVLHLNLSHSEPFGPPPGAEGILSLLRFVPADWDVEWFVHNYNNRFNNDRPEEESHRLLNVLAICMGGHVRTGVGDLPVWGGRRARSAEMVADLVRVAETVGREVATTAEARQMLGFRPVEAPAVDAGRQVVRS